ncbi:MAG: radical SAM protein [Desulfobacteraceae bacterium 4572_87]|nr:MAG: radical SAM protein [Desulfobacteraceae bacterium 4572_87]
MIQTEQTQIPESPEYLRMSLAAAMTLGLKPGRFYRNAKLYCINLLLTYRSGCAARCAYCGLSNKRTGQYNEKSFIRVSWPTHSLKEIIERISERTHKVKRICISQITNKRSVQDTKDICSGLRSGFDIPVSLLISPTILSKEDLLDFKDAGADKIGVAIDLATPELFDQYRGKGVGGPHKWETYGQCLSDAIAIFGKRNAGSHFVTGMGETEKEMVGSIQKVQDSGGWTHLFSFFPETDSQMKDHPMPEIDHYRRIQLAGYLMDEGLSRAEKMAFDPSGRILDFGLPTRELNRIIDTGEPFRTSGCEGYDGQVACNRPFANSRPGPNMRNYPFSPTGDDIARIRHQMKMGGV